MASPSIAGSLLLIVILQIVCLTPGRTDQINEADYEPDYWRDKNDACPYSSSGSSSSGSNGNVYNNGGSSQTSAMAVGARGNNVQCYCQKNGQQQQQQQWQQPQQQWQQPQQQYQQPQQQWQQPSQQQQCQNPNKNNPAMVGAAMAGAAALGAAGGAAAMAATHHQKPPSPPQNNNYGNSNNNNNNNQQDGPPKCNYCIKDHCNPATCKKANNFNAAEDAKRLQKAVEGVGTDEKTLIDILTQRSDEQIEMIRQEYVRCGRTLGSDIDGDTSFKTKDLLKAIVTPRPLYYAEELERAFHHGETDTIIEIFTSLSDCAIREVSSEYEKRFHKSLPESVEKKTCFDFEKLILELAKGNREQNQQVNVEAAKKDADDLVKAGVKKWFGTDEDKFIKIFATRSWTQLKEILKQYDLKRSQGIENDIKSETSGKLQKGLLALVQNIRDQPKYFAEQLEKSLDTLIMPGPNDNNQLIRIMRGRCGVDLGDIRDAYPKRYKGKKLADRISGKTYMDYETALLAMIKQ